MDALSSFLQDHARTHSSLVAESEGRFYLEDVLFRGLQEEDARQAPQEINSIAWNLWHIARCEDVAINLVVAGRPQVLDSEHWSERLGVSRRDIGTGMTKAEMQELSSAIDVTALRAYRAAVGKRTREVVQALPAERWADKYGEEARRRTVEAGALSPRAEWVQQFWEEKSMAWFITWLCAGHNYMHIGQARAVKALLRPGTAR